MGVTFSEGRGLPHEFTRGGGYEGFRGYGGGNVEDTIKAISPWELLTGIFVTKPAQEKQAAIDLAKVQSDAAAHSQSIRSDNLETLLKYGAMGVGALVLVIFLTKRRAPPVAGYRRSKKRSKRSRR